MFALAPIGLPIWVNVRPDLMRRSRESAAAELTLGIERELMIVDSATYDVGSEPDPRVFDCTGN